MDEPGTTETRNRNIPFPPLSSSLLVQHNDASVQTVNDSSTNHHLTRREYVSKNAMNTCQIDGREKSILKLALFWSCIGLAQQYSRGQALDRLMRMRRASEGGENAIEIVISTLGRLVVEIRSTRDAISPVKLKRTPMFQAKASPSV